MSTLDPVDLQILQALQENARTAHAEIARRVGMASSAIVERVRKLEERGLIRGYEVALEPRAIDLGMLAFVFIRSDDSVATWPTAERLAALPEVQEVHDLAGEDCYLIKVRVADPEALHRFLREKLGAIPGIRTTRTTIVLKTLKETPRLPLPTPGDVGGSDGAR